MRMLQRQNTKRVIAKRFNNNVNSNLSSFNLTEKDLLKEKQKAIDMIESIKGSISPYPSTVAFSEFMTNANGTSAASSASSSITPQQPADFYSIQTVTVDSGSSSTISFSSIPQTYKHLQLRIYGHAGAADSKLSINASKCFLGSEMFFEEDFRSLADA